MIGVLDYNYVIYFIGTTTYHTTLLCVTVSICPFVLCAKLVFHFGHAPTLLYTLVYTCYLCVPTTRLLDFFLGSTGVIFAKLCIAFRKVTYYCSRITGEQIC